jgi:hypothetical protein
VTHDVAGNYVTAFLDSVVIVKHRKKILQLLPNEYYGRNKLFYNFVHNLYPRILCSGTLCLRNTTCLYSKDVASSVLRCRSRKEPHQIVSMFEFCTKPSESSRSWSRSCINRMRLRNTDVHCTLYSYSIFYIYLYVTNKIRLVTIN